MYSKTVVASIVGMGLFLSANLPALAAGSPDACSLLSPDQVGAALGVAVGAGQPSTGGAACRWTENGKPETSAKMVQVDIMGQMGRMSPVDRFNAARQALGNQEKPTVAGVGDDAYYIINPNLKASFVGCSINVRKRTSAFNVHIGGMSTTQVQPILKVLAQQAASKL